ncbi:unnamed protein product, partial [Ascophyllum nodosum]
PGGGLDGRVGSGVGASYACSFKASESFQHWQGPRAAGVRGRAGSLHRVRPKCRPEYRGRQPRGHPPPAMVNHRS